MNQFPSGQSKKCTPKNLSQSKNPSPSRQFQAGTSPNPRKIQTLSFELSSEGDVGSSTLGLTLVSFDVPALDEEEVEELLFFDSLPRCDLGVGWLKSGSFFISSGERSPLEEVNRGGLSMV